MHTHESIEPGKGFRDFCAAYHFLQNHRIYQGHFLRQLDLEVVKVDPETGSIHFADADRNTRTQIWLESGPYREDCLTHDPRLDCGGDTFEEAILALAELVQTYYGNEQIEPDGCSRMVILE